MNKIRKPNMVISMLEEMKYLISSQLYNVLTNIVALSIDGYTDKDERLKKDLHKFVTIINMWPHTFIIDLLDGMHFNDTHIFIRYRIVSENVPPWVDDFTPSEAFEFITDMKNDVTKMEVYPVYNIKIRSVTSTIRVVQTKVMNISG